MTECALELWRRCGGRCSVECHTLAQLDDVLVFVECVATEPNRRTINVDKIRFLAMHDGIGSTHECQTWNKDFVIWLSPATINDLQRCGAIYSRNAGAPHLPVQIMLQIDPHIFRLKRPNQSQCNREQVASQK